MQAFIKRKKTVRGAGTPKPVAKKNVTTLVNKLDKVFSLYIRKRDAMPYGGRYFKCISCGRVLPFEQADCGHFWSRRHMATRFDEDNCNSECSHCLTPDALILTDDLRWVSLGDIQEGQKLFAFEEERGKAQARYWKRATVTHIHREIQDVYAVTLANGDVVKTTKDHKWLARERGDGAYKWIKTMDLWVNGVNLEGKHKTGPHTHKTSSVVCKPFLVVEQEKSYEAGWLAGMLDADGHVCQQNINNPDGTVRYGMRAGIAQSSHYPELCKRIVELIEHFTNNHKPCRQWMDMSKINYICGREIKSRVQTWQFLVTGTNVEKLQFLMRIRPHKIFKIDVNKCGMIRSQYDTKVASVKYIGKQEIVVMETDTHTFIANGYAMHNCNRFDGSHLLGYRDNLIKKIGQRRYDILNYKHTTTKKWSAFELEQLIEYYTILNKSI